jgi:hypothetical protein
LQLRIRPNYVRGNLHAPAFHLPEANQMIRRCAAAEERPAREWPDALHVFQEWN